LSNSKNRSRAACSRSHQYRIKIINRRANRENSHLEHAQVDLTQHKESCYYLAKNTHQKLDLYIFKFNRTISIFRQSKSLSSTYRSVGWLFNRKCDSNDSVPISFIHRMMTTNILNGAATDIMLKHIH
jgi:hypothetical protein